MSRGLDAWHLLFGVGTKSRSVALGALYRGDRG